MKNNILTSIILFALFIVSLSFGVYSFFQSSVAANGEISFDAEGVDVDIEINIKCPDGTNKSYFGTTNKTRSPEKELIGDVWNYGNISFENSLSGNHFDMEINILTTNYSEHNVISSVTLPYLNGLNIDIPSGNDIHSYSYDSSFGADERLIRIKVIPQIGVFNGTSNFNFSLQVYKVIDNETAISKFQWSTPSNGEISVTGNNFNTSDEKIILPRKNGNHLVTGIAANAFKSSAFQSITLPNSIKNIGNNAFDECRGLLYIVIPKSVLSIGESAFQSCSGLKRFDVSRDNLNYCSDDAGVLYNKLQTKLLQYPAGGSEYYKIPFGVTNIGWRSFFYNSRIKNVIIPDSVTVIEDSVFSGCAQITSITIPDSVTNIGVGAFLDSGNIQSVFIEKISNFANLSPFCFLGIKNGSIIYFKSISVSNQFIDGTHYSSSLTTKVLY